MTFDEAFLRLSRSTFRSRFHLSAADRLYIAEKGWEAIRRHAADFVRQKLAPAHPVKDGRQTPMRGHPVFIAQHATATCCRGCMNKWWKVPLGVALSPERQTKTVNLILSWLHREINGLDAIFSTESQNETVFNSEVRKEASLPFRHGFVKHNPSSSILQMIGR